MSPVTDRQAHRAWFATAVEHAGGKRGAHPSFRAAFRTAITSACADGSVKLDNAARAFADYLIIEYKNRTERCLPLDPLERAEKVR